MRWVTRLGLQVLLFLVAAELLVRVVQPVPRTQILRDGAGIELAEADGTVTWKAREPAVVSDACAFAPVDALHVAFVGSSIFRGSGVEGPDVFTERMRWQVDGRGGVCIDNLAQPAFTAEQKRVVALQALARPRPPDVIYWEVWQNDPGHFVRFGDSAYNVFAYPVDAQGRPDPLGLGETVGGALWATSSVYELLVLGLGRDGADLAAWEEMVQRDLRPVAEAAAAVGTDLVLVICPPLDRSFSLSSAKPFVGYAAIWPFAQSRGLRWIRLSLLLEEDAVADLRADTCCHYNPLGHERLATLFAADVRQVHIARFHASMRR